MIPWPPDRAFYLYHPEIFRNDLDSFTGAFRRHIPATTIALSLKTCALPALLRDGRAAGTWAEVVSEAEYRYARHLGWPAAQIIVNGPAKSPTLLHLAWTEGALVQIDSAAELDWLETHRPHGETPWRCGLRCATTLPGEPESRFGFSLQRGDARRAVDRLRALPHTTLESLHLHACTSARAAADYHRMAAALRDFAATLPGPPVPCLNLGGGFLSPAPQEFQRQFPFPWTTFEAYAAALASTWPTPPGHPPTLILEPGLAVMARCLSFFARVVEIKPTATGSLIVCTGSCYNIKPSKSRRNLPLRLHPCGTAPRLTLTQADIVGYTCMEDDILHRGFSGTIAVGDLIEFAQVGAYTLTLKPPFIEPAPPVYQRRADGGCDLIQPVQTWQHMFRCDQTTAPSP